MRTYLKLPCFCLLFVYEFVSLLSVGLEPMAFLSKVEGKRDVNDDDDALIYSPLISYPPGHIRNQSTIYIDCWFKDTPLFVPSSHSSTFHILK